MAGMNSQRLLTLLNRELQEYRASLLYTPVVIAGLSARFGDRRRWIDHGRPAPSVPGGWPAVSSREHSNRAWKADIAQLSDTESEERRTRMIRETIQQLLEGQSLPAEQAEAVMDQIMTGTATPAQIAGFLVKIRQRTEPVGSLGNGYGTLRVGPRGQARDPQVGGLFLNTARIREDNLGTGIQLQKVQVSHGLKEMHIGK